MSSVCEPVNASSQRESSVEQIWLPRYPLKLLLIPAAILLVQIMRKMGSESPLFLNHDEAFGLHCGLTILDGKLPYVGCLDIAPPAFYYMHVLPWLVARLFSIDVMWAILGIIYCVVLSSCICMTFLLRDAVLKSTRLSDWLAFGPLACAFLLFNLAAIYHFGQREHVFLLGLWPFFIVRWLRCQAYCSAAAVHINRTAAFVAGLLLTYPVCCKPHFLIVIGALELYWMWKIRHQLWTVVGKRDLLILNPGMCLRWLVMQPETLPIVCGLALYVLHFFFLPAPMLVSYFGRILPLAMRGYDALDQPFIPYILYITHTAGNLGNVWALGLTCILAGVLAFRKNSSLLMPLLVWTVAGEFIFCLQKKGWSYQSLPLVCGYFLLVNLELALITQWIWEKIPWLNRFTKDFLKRSVLLFFFYGLIAVPLFPFLIHDSMKAGKQLSEPFEQISTLIKERSKPGDPILVLNTDCVSAYPLLIQMNRRPGSRYLIELPVMELHYIEHNASSAADKWFATTEEEKVANEIFEDIRNIHPRLIIIHNYYPSDCFSQGTIYDFVIQNGFFLKALQDDYTPLGQCDGYVVWELKEKGMQNSSSLSERGTNSAPRSSLHEKSSAPPNVDRTSCTDSAQLQDHSATLQPQTNAATESSFQHSSQVCTPSQPGLERK